METGLYNCKKCYWNEQCNFDFPCDDYTNIDEENTEEEMFYESILNENIEEYETIIREYN